MAIHKTINHDSGSPVSNHYTGSITDAGGRASIAAGAALNGSTEGLQLAMGDSNSVYLSEGMSAISTNVLVLTFYFDPNSAGVPSSGTDEIEVAVWNNTAVLRQAAIFIQLNASGDAYTVYGQVEDDGTTSNQSSSYTLSDGPHKLTIVVNRAASTSSNDGSFTLYVDDVAKETVSSLDIYDYWTGMDAIEVFGYASATTSGAVYIDEIVVLDAPVSNAFRFLGFAVDHVNLYVTGLKDEGTLEFYYYDLAALGENGPTGFGSATDTEIDDDDRGIYPLARPGADKVIYLYGRDGSDQHLQYNDLTGGAGWQDIGDGGWASAKIIRACLPDPLDPDDLIAIFDDDDIYRSEDNGSIWVKMGDAPANPERLGVRHPVRSNEFIIAGPAPALYFSHNFGVSFDTLANPGGIGAYYVVIYSDVGG